MKSNLPVVRLPGSGARVWTGLAFRNAFGDILSFQLLNGHGEGVGAFSMDSGNLLQLPLVADSVPAEDAGAFDAFGKACLEAQGKRSPLIAGLFYDNSPAANEFNGGRGFWGIQSGKDGFLLAVADSEADARAFVAGVNR